MVNLDTIARPTLADFTRVNIIAHCVNVEAGYVNNKADLGGETKYGITYATAQEHKAELVARFGWNGQVRDLTQEMALWIYQTQWWDRLCCDQLHEIHPFLADRVFDVGVNAGRQRGVVWLQEILNVLNRQEKDYPDVGVDGKLANDGQTIKALRAFKAKRGMDGIETLMQYLLGEQSHHYKSISESRKLNEEFTYGWGNRVKNINRLYQRTLQGLAA